MSVLIAGTVALDDLKTPFGEKKNILGGSAVHASVSSSFFATVAMCGVVGEDFPKEHIDFLKSRNINTAGILRIPGKTFHWEGYYEYDMNQAHTLTTDLNVLTSFNPVLSDEEKKSEFVFLANLDPDIQCGIIDQLKKPRIIALDSMNYWIDTKKKKLVEAVSKANIVLLNDMEARQFAGSPNLIAAAKQILMLGPSYVIIKKGEHGALCFSKEFNFAAPSFPQENLVDPTGAGDSFAGGLIGYLSRCKQIDPNNIKRAIVIGSVMASFNVEDFSLNRLRTLKPAEIVDRYNSIKQYCWFDEIEENIFSKGNQNV